MKIRQTVRHFAAKQALTLPVVGEMAREKLVDLHTRVFLEKAEPEHREERREHLDALFEATIDTYVVALDAGYTEAEAREITHIQGNFDFYNHGWTEMMEFPADELEDHYERYREFFEEYDITIDDPLGRFEPTGGLPEAPSTPEKLEDPEHPHAEGGFADDVYVEDGDGEIRVGGQEEPEDVDVSEAPGVDGSDATEAESDD
jgi:PAS domain-containing protein